MADKDSVSDQLNDHFINRFGYDWRHNLSLTVRADNLYWLIRLAEWGIESRRKAYQESKGLEAALNAASGAASLASWQLDLEQLVNQIMSAPLVEPKKKGKK